GWHTHTCDQILVVTSGSGKVANEHEEREINVGDVVRIKAGERHWHGAKANTTMGHITITLVGGQAKWGGARRAVSGEEGGVAVGVIGWIGPGVGSELIPPSGPPFDAEVVAETARIHERAGFDRVLIGYFTDAPDGFLIGAHAASVTERLQFLLAHRPGF